jgi:allantoin racemase
VVELGDQGSQGRPALQLAGVDLVDRDPDRRLVDLGQLADQERRDLARDRLRLERGLDRGEAREQDHVAIARRHVDVRIRQPALQDLPGQPVDVGRQPRPVVPEPLLDPGERDDLQAPGDQRSGPLPGLCERPQPAFETFQARLVGRRRPRARLGRGRRVRTRREIEEEAWIVLRPEQVADRGRQSHGQEVRTAGADLAIYARTGLIRPFAARRPAAPGRYILGRSPMGEPIVVVNPNSTAAVTSAIERALMPLCLAGGPAIECVTLAEGPPGIETQAHVEQVVQPLCRLVRTRADAAAFVIACFSDPGLHACREATARPVLGIAECGLLTALTRGERFGIIAILAGSLARHQRYVRQLGLTARFAGELPLGLGVVELADAGRTYERMRAVGTRLRDHDGADVLVLGCAGMAQYRAGLEAEVGLPVIDPTQAAVTMALGAVQLASR